MRKKKKIEIATPKEVGAYGGRDGAPGAEETTETGVADRAEQTGDKHRTADDADGEVRPEDELAAARRKIEELTDKHLRAVAEHQNYVRRSQAEHRETLRYAAAGLARSLLEVVDDFERTRAAVPAEDTSPLAQGVRLVYDKLTKVLESHHVRRTESVGLPFDPARHEAMLEQPTDEHPPGTVVEECQAGYELWDRVLRPAKVIVAKSIEVAGAEPPADAEAEARAGQE